MENQHRFVADAAHELRSPLTALSLQAERLAQAEMSMQARERLSSLHHGIERHRHLLSQLLTLAKAQADAERSGAVVSMQRIFQHVLEDLFPLVEARHIDIGVESLSLHDVQIRGNEHDLLTLIRNLVDNAIRHTPVGHR